LSDQEMIKINIDEKSQQRHKKTPYCFILN